MVMAGVPLGCVKKHSVTISFGIASFLNSFKRLQKSPGTIPIDRETEKYMQFKYNLISNNNGG